MSKISDPILAKDEPKLKKASISIFNLASFVRYVEGKLLTIMEATINEKEKKMATKSLVRNALWDTYSEIYQWAINQKEGEGSSFPIPSNKIEE